MKNVLHSHNHDVLPDAGPPLVPSFSQHAPHLRETEPNRPRQLVGLENARAATNLASHPLQELRILANQMYRLIDTDFPPAGALERYQAIAEELDVRAQQVADHQPTHDPHETFQDSVFNSRFELYLDGKLAASMKYTMDGGQVRLLNLVVHPHFQHLNLEPVLMRHSMLNAHKRRLEIVPVCPVAAAFLKENPHFLTLAPRLHHTTHQAPHRPLDITDCEKS